MCCFQFLFVLDIVNNKVDEYFAQRKVGPLHVQIPTGIATNWSNDEADSKTTQEKESIVQAVIDIILQGIDNHSTALIDELKHVNEMTDDQLIKQVCVRRYIKDTEKLWNTWDETFQKRVTNAIEGLLYIFVSLLAHVQHYNYVIFAMFILEYLNRQSGCSSRFVR